MINYVEILNNKVNGVLATTDGTLIQTRVFQSLWIEDNKVYFCTGKQKDVFKQLSEHKIASFCVENKFSPVISVNGYVHFTEDLTLKQKAFEILPMLKKIYETPENPAFAVFYIDIKEVKTFSYAEGSKEYII